MTKMALFPALFPTVLAGVFLTFPVQADAIDGDWCTKSGRHLSIEGPKIKTPGGKNMTGNYDRHGFDYVIPKGESDSGKNAVMVIHDDETMQMTIGKGKAQIWKRCAAPIS
jgi:hypothetical protein